MTKHKPIPLDDAFEAVSVHDVDEQAGNNVVGWYGVSTDASVNTDS